MKFNYVGRRLQVSYLQSMVEKILISMKSKGTDWGRKSVVRKLLQDSIVCAGQYPMLDSAVLVNPTAQTQDFISVSIFNSLVCK